MILNYVTPEIFSLFFVFLFFKGNWLNIFVFLFSGAGGAILTKFEQLVKGDWKPGGDEWLKMS